MARVLLVHGAFNEFWGPHELKARWLPALRDGRSHHDVEPLRCGSCMIKGRAEGCPVHRARRRSLYHPLQQPLAHRLLSARRC
jgi:hypothetical protein